MLSESNCTIYAKSKGLWFVRLFQALNWNLALMIMCAAWKLRKEECFKVGLRWREIVVSRVCMHCGGCHCTWRMMQVMKLTASQAKLGASLVCAHSNMANSIEALDPSSTTVAQLPMKSINRSTYANDGARVRILNRTWILACLRWFTYASLMPAIVLNIRSYYELALSLMLSTLDSRRFGSNEVV